MAETFTVTNLHYITVDANGNVVGSLSPSATVVEVNDSPSSSFQPTTLQTVTASYASVEATSQTPSISTTAQAASSSASSSSNSGSGIYAEISSSGVDASFAKSILDAHNSDRAKHSAGDLSWSSELYSYAQSYADKYSCGGSLVHSGGQYGENLAVGYSSGSAAVAAWYSEGDSYSYSSNVLNHFTQVIWKGTTKLGCAYKSCGSGLYVVCEYDPAGNFIGQESSNLSAN